MSYTLGQLIKHYRTDPDSRFAKLSYQVRIKQDRLLTRIDKEHGHLQLRGIRARMLLAWYDIWASGGKWAMAYEMMVRLRAMFSFGFALLEDQECERLHKILKETRFRTLGARSVEITKEHVQAIRTTAREHFGWPSIGLTQAFQFELLLPQKDAIGEWVPVSESGESDIVWRGKKWLRGLQWSSIDKNLILRHASGAGGRPIEVDLRTAPMVMEELYLIYGAKDPEQFPKSGPIVLCDITGMPWIAGEFRRKWRLVAKKAGVPDKVKNRDSVPAGMIVGGPDRARVSQGISIARINNSLRTRRR
jgi:hypothetical protein